MKMKNKLFITMIIFGILRSNMPLFYKLIELGKLYFLHKKSKNMMELHSILCYHI